MARRWPWWFRKKDPEKRKLMGGQMCLDCWNSFSFRLSEEELAVYEPVPEDEEPRGMFDCSCAIPDYD